MEATNATISYAGYGVYNSTVDVTTSITTAYRGGQRVFLANNTWGGDPAPGQRKYLYITWAASGNQLSGVTGEGDQKGINL